MVEGIQETERSQEAIYREPEPRKEQVQDAQQGIALEMLQQQTTGTSSRNNQLLQLLASVQPQQTIDKTAQEQIKQGYIDIRV